MSLDHAHLVQSLFLVQWRSRTLIVQSESTATQERGRRDEERGREVGRGERERREGGERGRGERERREGEREGVRRGERKRQRSFRVVYQDCKDMSIRYVEVQVIILSSLKLNSNCSVANSTLFSTHTLNNHPHTEVPLPQDTQTMPMKCVHKCIAYVCMRAVTESVHVQHSLRKNPIFAFKNTYAFSPYSHLQPWFLWVL